MSKQPVRRGRSKFQTSATQRIKKRLLWGKPLRALNDQEWAACAGGSRPGMPFTRCVANVRIGQKLPENKRPLADT
jgi:hypothetical protein